MTPTEINRAIAELRGARDIRISNRWEVTDPPEAPCVDVGLFADGIRAIPDYYHSLDACASFEGTIKLNEDQCIYRDMLIGVVSGDMRNGIGMDGELMCNDFDFATATAPQRCEAFLRMHGKWRDE